MFILAALPVAWIVVFGFEVHTTICGAKIDFKIAGLLK